MTNGSLMKVESIAECSPWSMLQYFWPALSINWSWEPIFGLFESGHFTQVLLYFCFTVTQDDSSDDEVNKYFEPEIVSSDGEADLQLERRLSGKHRPEKVPGSST